MSHLSKLMREAEGVLEEVQGQRVVVALGGTGAGKTTFLHFLAGSVLQRTANGKYDVVTAGPEMDGFSIGHEARSQTRNLRSFRCKHTSTILVDSCGFEDTENPAVDLAMSILVKKIAESCRGIRFVLFVDHNMLESLRGQLMRTTAKWVDSLVTSFERHKRAFTFIFTKLELPDSKKGGDSPTLADMRTALASRLEDILRSSPSSAQNDSWLQILGWLCSDLSACEADAGEDAQGESPHFVDAFHPEYSDRKALLDMVSPSQDDPGDSDSDEPMFITANPGQEVRCGITLPQADRLRASLDNSNKDLQLCLEQEGADVSLAKEKMLAMKYLKEHLDLPIVQEAWDTMHSHIDQTLKRLHASAVSTISEDRVLQAKQVMGQLGKLEILGRQDASRPAEEFLEQHLQGLAKELISLENPACLVTSFAPLTSKLMSLKEWVKEFDHHALLLDSSIRALKDFVALLTQTASDSTRPPEQVLYQVSLLRQIEAQSSSLADVNVDAEMILTAVSKATHTIMESVRQLRADLLRLLQQAEQSRVGEGDLEAFKHASEQLNAIRTAAQMHDVPDVKEVIEAAWDRVISQMQATCGAVRDTVGRALEAMPTASLPFAAQDEDQHDDANVIVRDLILNLDGLHKSLPAAVHKSLPQLDVLYEQTCSAVTKLLETSLHSLQGLCTGMENSGQVYEVERQERLLQTISLLEWIDERDVKAGSRRIFKSDGSVSQHREELKKRHKSLWKEHHGNLLQSLSSYLQKPSAQDEDKVNKNWELSEAVSQLCRLDSSCNADVHQLLNRFIDPDEPALMDRLKQPPSPHDLASFPAAAGNRMLSLGHLTLSSLVPGVQELHASVEFYLKEVAASIKSLFAASGKYEQKESVMVTLNGWSDYNFLLNSLPKAVDLQQKVLEDINAIAATVEGSMISGNVCQDATNALELAQQIAAMQVPSIQRPAEDLVKVMTRRINEVNSQVDDEVEHCIRSLHFKELRNLLQPLSFDQRSCMKFRDLLQKVEAVLNEESSVDPADGLRVAAAWKVLRAAQDDIGDFMEQYGEVDVGKKLHNIEDAAEAHLSTRIAQAEGLLMTSITDFQHLRTAVEAATRYSKTTKDALKAKPGARKQLDVLVQAEQDRIAQVDKLIAHFLKDVQERQACDSRLYGILGLAKHQQLPLYSTWQQRLRAQLEDLHQKVQADLSSSSHFHRNGTVVYEYLLQEWRAGLAQHVPGLSFSIERELKQLRDKGEQRLSSLRSGDWNMNELERDLNPRRSDLSKWMWEWFGTVECLADVNRKHFRTNVNELLDNIAELQTRRDLTGIRGLLQTTKSITQRFHKHLQEPQWERLNDIKKTCVKDFRQLCTSAAEQVSCGEYRSCSSSLKIICEYLREVAPVNNILTDADLQGACNPMQMKFCRHFEEKHSELEEMCKALNFRGLRSSLEDLRGLAKLLTCEFAVYAIDLKVALGKDSHAVDQVMSTLKRELPSTELWELGRAFAILELPTDTSDSSEISRQKRKLSAKYHPDKRRRCDSRCEQSEIMQRINGAAYELGRHTDTKPGAGTYQLLLQGLYSEKVREIAPFQLEEVRRLLSQRLYDEVRHRCDALGTIELVTELVKNPPMDAREILQSMRAEISNHASHLGASVQNHCNEQKYCELQRDLQALKTLISSFSVGYDTIYTDASQIYKDVTCTMKERIRDAVDQAWCTQRLPRDVVQMKRFARNILDLGRIWSEVPEFREEVRGNIDSLLCYCLEDVRKGPFYLHMLGSILSKGDVDGVTDQESLANSASVGQHIINEFAQFKDVQVMLWNQTVRKTQMDPEACIKQMQMKDMIENKEMSSATDTLMEALKIFQERYDSLLQSWIDQALTVDDLVTSVLQEANDLQDRHSQAGKLNMTSARPWLPRILAGVFLHYTITTSGDSYRKLKEASERETVAEAGGLPRLDDVLVTPHNAQILAVLQMLGCGRASEGAGSLNHLLQVRTGEGKSLILGAAATLFALLGFRVCCVCYSEYLSKRDRNTFRRTFSDFRVTELVKYSKITEYSEESALKRGNIREMTLRMLGALRQAPADNLSASSSHTAGPARQMGEASRTAVNCVNASNDTSPSLQAVEERIDDASLSLEDMRRGPQAPEGEQGGMPTQAGTSTHSTSNLEPVMPGGKFRSEEVLLIDEVDVLFGQDFYGRTHDQFVKVPDEDASAILQDLWSRGANESAWQLQEAVKQSEHYRRLLQKYAQFSDMVNVQVSMMCAHLLEYVQGAPPLPVVYGGRVGYKVMDGIDYDIVDGYKTAFAHLEHRRRLTGEAMALKEALCLLVPCGQFSYARIEPTYMFGVSGTVDELDNFQRRAIAKYGIRSYSMLPSVYGNNSTKFLDLDNAIEIVPTENFFLRIAKAVEDKVQHGDYQRAIIVFFQDAEMLDEFLKSKEASGLRSPNVLRETLSDTLKEHYIRKAATVGQVTLATAIFGRGCDFACFDEQLHQHGGMHVIQTFVSKDLSEEVQIKGRTARQGKSGTFSMILNAETLAAELDVPASVTENGQRECYDMINQARLTKHQDHFKAMQQALSEANRKDEATDLYFRDLLLGDWKSAEMRFRQVWKNAMAKNPSQISIHFLVCLDKSGSMLGNKFMCATYGALTFLRSAQKLDPHNLTRFSLILFNDAAQVVAERAELAEADQIFKWLGGVAGGTAFDAPLAQAIDLIQGSLTKFDHHVIMLYTDGIAPYPAGETSNLCRLRAEHRNMDFFAICEDANPATLQQVCTALYPGIATGEHCMSAVQPQQICGKMQEVLQRMNMGFVRKVTAASEQ